MTGTEPPVSRSGQAHTRRWIIVALVAVALLIGTLTVFVLVSDRAVIHDGPGTAVISWTPVRQDLSGGDLSPAPQPFTAVLDGRTASGTSTTVLTTESAPHADSSTDREGGTFPVFHYRGRLAGHAFDLTVGYRLVPPSDLAGTEGLHPSLPATEFTVQGTYDGMPVRATITSPVGDGPSASAPARLVGTIGHWKVTGRIPRPTGTSSRQSVTAHFVVSG